MVFISLLQDKKLWSIERRGTTMIKFEKTEVVGWEPAIRGMRNPMNSWEKSDTHSCGTCGDCDNCIDYDNCPYGYDYLKTVIGPNDHELMMKLAKGGPVHAKYRRMITVYVDITAPLYWWKEFDTYKIGTVANSCSTMHKIHAKEFTRDDFSWDHLVGDNVVPDHDYQSSTYVLDLVIESLNFWRDEYLTGKESGITKDKRAWWQMIQLLPSSYNQKRTVELNYEVLVGIYKHRKNHKLDEWLELCSWIESLPYSEFITLGEEDDGDEEV
jgi:hypothetical protein